jgi:hypothetical protein
MTFPGPAAWIGVPAALTMSMPVWKWAQFPSGGSM